MRRHIELLALVLASATLLLSCAVSRSARTVAEARAFIYGDMPIAEITAWAGVTPSSKAVARTGSYIPSWYTYQYHLADGELYVLQEIGKDKVSRARVFKFEKQ